jgi:hypothetical protein
VHKISCSFSVTLISPQSADLLVLYGAFNSADHELRFETELRHGENLRLAAPDDEQ